MTIKIGLFDLDQTLADYEGQLRNDLELIRSPNEPVAVEDLHNESGYLGRRVKLIRSVPGWWLNLPRIEKNFTILNIAKKMGFEIHVLTKGPRSNANAWAEKLLWCQKHIDPKVDITITFDKSLVYGTFLMDDFPEYVEKWLNSRPRGISIMPVHSYNKDYNHPRCVKYDGTNVNEVKDKLQEAFDRK